MTRLELEELKKGDILTPIKQDRDNIKVVQRHIVGYYVVDVDDKLNEVGTDYLLTNREILSFDIL